MDITKKEAELRQLQARVEEFTQKVRKLMEFIATSTDPDRVTEAKIHLEKAEEILTNAELQLAGYVVEEDDDTNPLDAPEPWAIYENQEREDKPRAGWASYDELEPEL
jgi:hypothetical protein